MTKFYIEQIRTQPVNSNNWKEIVAVQGRDDRGQRNAYFLSGIIQIIEAGIPVYSSSGSNPVRVVVVQESSGKFIRSIGDLTTSNNLLSLERF
jgi:hypothetical protein